MKITNLSSIIVCAVLMLAPVVMTAQNQGGLDPSAILKPLSDSWLTYSGDYSGKRYSTLTQINQSTVKNLTLAWVARLTAGPGVGGASGGGTPTMVGGEGSADFAGGGVTVKGSILQVDGVLYVSAPDNAWAVDARDGHVLWHYFWKTKGGTHIGNRGMGMWNNYLFLETPDDYLVSLDARTGEERWHKVIADFNQQYFSTMAPIVIGNHVLVGTGNDLDAPGFLQSFDPETGELQWRHYTVPMNPGDPGLETWPSLEAARHGGAQVWIPGSYDPETHLYIFGTGNPTPAYTTGRGDLDNLFTCSLVAVNVDTGKMAWYYQTSPHDTHDWDSTQTPVLADAPFNGRMRKLVMTAARNGYFFVLDRATGEHLLTSKFGTATNWALGLDKNGAPKRNPEKDATVPGSLITGSTTNWPPPAYSPDAGLFYVPENNSYALSYLIDVDPRGSMGLGGIENANVGAAVNFLTAIDYRTGEVAWRHELQGGGATGLLSTAGKLIFAGSGSNLMAFDPASGKTLWHSRIGNQSNAPETYMLDGHQYLLAVAGDTMFAFTLY
jgi:alcohol dehydrogenase (cytochrome c)